MERLIALSSPKFDDTKSTRSIMLDMIIALIPALVGGIIIFGWRSLLIVAVSAGSAVIFESVYCLLTKKEQSVIDLSALVTGIIIGLILPPAVPVWVGAVGSAIAIIFAKQIFGGLGKNFANPAIVARIILSISFPVLMTTWTAPCAWMNTVPDTVTSATPLADNVASATYWNMFLGIRGGCIGEVCIMLIICGGLYLIARKIISPVIPISFIGTIVIAAFLAGKDPLIWTMSGGVIFAAIFMATDLATCPKTPLGQLIFGIGCGLFTALLRLFSGSPEGVAIAILFMNILAPYIDKLILMIPIKQKDQEHHSEEESPEEEAETPEETAEEEQAESDTEVEEETEAEEQTEEATEEEETEEPTEETEEMAEESTEEESE